MIKIDNNRRSLTRIDLRRAGHKPYSLHQWATLRFVENYKTIIACQTVIILARGNSGRTCLLMFMSVAADTVNPGCVTGRTAHTTTVRVAVVSSG